MMRPLHVWIAFVACGAVLIAALGWVSMTVVRLDTAEAVAREHADAEANVRLALWRMDSALAPLVASESTRPYFAYRPFYPAQRAYTNMLLPINQGEVLVPSPLLNQPSPEVLLHFLVGPDGVFTSPQVPTGKVRELAEQGFTTPRAIQLAAEQLQRLQATVSRDALLSRLAVPAASPLQVAMLPDERDQRVVSQGGQAQARQPRQRAARPGQFDLQQRSERQSQQMAVNRLDQQDPGPQASQPALSQELQQVQGLKNVNEFNARASNILSGGSFANNDPVLQQPVTDVHEGRSRAIWLGEQLMLARRVVVGDAEYVQGCWLDWPGIERRLLHEIYDLLPNARLEPIRDLDGDSQGRVLAALPVLLVPGKLLNGSDQLPSPLHISLKIAWICVLLAAAAVAVLLAGALSLSERRGAFVSAVTHEMRTPLTTFRMYTEMLAKGMVPSERRVRYLDTLRIEADRLAHLVENVLAYARLERGRAVDRLETTTPALIIDRVASRLADRAEQASMKIDIDLGTAADAAVQADPTAVEQILFNLVDNACKYAAVCEDRSIRLRASAANSTVNFEVSDHGPGVSAEQRTRLFRPFSKSAQQAAHSAPGVGLGLALSRRLARSMGGELRLSHNGEHGATFVLELPALQ